MFTRDSSRQGRETGKEHFGGVMAAGMRVTLEMEFKVDGESSIEREESNSTREIGITACSTAKELSISKTDSATKVPSKRINSTGKAYSTRTIQLFMEFGRTTNYQLLTW